MPFCYVPKGPFLLGSTEEDKGAYEDEQPQHELDLPAYWISRYPITNAQYTQFVEAGGYGVEHYWSEAQEQGIWKEGKVYLEWAMMKSR